MPGSDTKTPSCPHLGRSTAGKKYLQRQAPMFTCMRLIAHLVKGVFCIKCSYNKCPGADIHGATRKQNLPQKPTSDRLRVRVLIFNNETPHGAGFYCNLNFLGKSKNKLLTF